MAGEKITVIAGKPISVRATAGADVAQGDFIMLERSGSGNNEWGGTAGFWLHDVKKDDVGDVCIFCEVAEIPSDSKAYSAGKVLIAQQAGIGYDTTRTQYRASTYNCVIIYEDVAANATRMKVVWGLH